MRLKKIAYEVFDIKKRVKKVCRLIFEEICGKYSKNKYFGSDIFLISEPEMY